MKEIKCPKCGNTEDFTEVLNGCCLEVNYKRDRRGKWKKVNCDVNSNVDFELTWECTNCQTDCTDQHEEFLNQYMNQK